MAMQWWKPTANTTFNIDLIDQPTSFAPPSVFQAYDIDLFNTANDTIAQLHAQGNKVICYFSSGTSEQGRPDLASIPASAIGSELPDWPGEHWLDTTDPNVRNVMSARIAMAAAKGCDAIDPDNVDAYNNKPGIAKLSQDTAIDWVKFLADQAHQKGLACGLKNAGEIIPSVLSSVDFCVNEQCAANNECDTFRPFVDAGKPVFELEYIDQKENDHPPSTAPKSVVSKSCSGANNQGFQVLLKRMKLDEWTALCPDGHQVSFEGQGGSQNTSNAATSQTTQSSTSTAASAPRTASLLWPVLFTTLLFVGPLASGL